VNLRATRVPTCVAPASQEQRTHLRPLRPPPYRGTRRYAGDGSGSAWRDELRGLVDSVPDDQRLPRFETGGRDALPREPERKARWHR
jgi:hypothetical protein